MKIRFVRQTLPEFVASLIEVQSLDELYAAIRQEKNLSEDFGLEEALKINPYNEYVAPEASFGRNFQIYVIGIGLIGFCDSTLKALQPSVKKFVAPKGPYRIDNRYLDHTCCYSAAIVREPTEQEKKNGKTSPVKIVDCAAGNARMIRDALNVYHSLNHKS